MAECNYFQTISEKVENGNPDYQIYTQPENIVIVSFKK
jgi:hypothetical protein